MGRYRQSLFKAARKQVSRDLQQSVQRRCFIAAGKSLSTSKDRIAYFAVGIFVFLIGLAITTIHNASRLSKLENKQNEIEEFIKLIRFDIVNLDLKLNNTVGNFNKIVKEVEKNRNSLKYVQGELPAASFGIADIERFFSNNPLKRTSRSIWEFYAAGFPQF